MLASFLVVGFGTSSLALQLLGVALSGFQSGMMESSYLAMASFYRSPKRCLTAWSSGTGLAGLGGYLWLRIFNKWGGLSFKTTLGIACIFPVLYVLAFVCILEQKQLPPARKHKNMVLQRAVENIDQAELAANIVASRASSVVRKSEDAYKQMTDDAVIVEEGKVVGLVDGSTTGFCQKMRFIFTLMPYILPLTVVYFAEYTMQTGVWSSIGFPVSDADARSDFYSSAGLCYQAGVFVSRSSGVVFQASRPVLYLMPFLQCVLLAFFVAVGATHFWFDSWLLILCFVVGLLGGAVYVNAYTLVSKEVKASHVELALCATSVGDTLGIILADIFGLVLQGCMYSLNGLTGATINVSC